MPTVLNIYNFNSTVTDEFVLSELRSFQVRLAQAIGHEPSLRFDLAVPGSDVFKVVLDIVDFCYESKLDEGIAYLDGSVLMSVAIQMTREKTIPRALDELVADDKTWSHPIFNSYQRNVKSDLLDNMVIFVPEGCQLENAYGDAVGPASGRSGFCLISNPHPRVIWHEVTHLFGVDDHYGNNVPCSDPMNCLMGSDATASTGFLCADALNEFNLEMIV